MVGEGFGVGRAGGMRVGSDRRARNDLRHFHSGDTYTPIEPAPVLGRLQTLGFDKITVMVDGILKFVARKPSGPGACGAEPVPGPGAGASPGPLARHSGAGAQSGPA